MLAAYSSSATISLVNESAYVLQDVSLRDACFVRKTLHVDPGTTRVYWVFPCGENIELRARAHDSLLSRTTYLSIIPLGRLTFRVQWSALAMVSLSDSIRTYAQTLADDRMEA